MIEKNDWEFNIKVKVKSQVLISEIQAFNEVLQMEWDANAKRTGCLISMHLPEKKEETK